MPVSLTSVKAAAERLLGLKTRTERGIEDLRALVPDEVFKLRTEAHVPLIAPWFFRSEKVPGDICEFGCFRGTLSLKLAWAVKALGLKKTVYAFDTFEGFKIDDPSGGALRVGAYSDNDNAFEVLTRWSAEVPLKPVKGDARETAKLVAGPLSFVWLDLDFDILMEPVLDTIWDKMHEGTILGIDDVGRPETPSVGPWVDKITAEGRLVELARYEGDFIRFFRKGR